MKKIPLEATLGGAYRFLFTNIVSIIGTVWFPWLVFVAVAAGLVCLIVPHAWLMGDCKTFDEAHLVALIPSIIAGASVLVVVGLVVRAMILVGLLRHALGEKQGMTLIYFSLGARVWRMVAALLFMVITVLLIELLAALVIGVSVGLTAALANHVPPVVTGLINALVDVVVICAAIYVAVRLLFFLPPVVVAENKVGIGRAWALGGGNFWRIIAVYLLVTIPVVFVGEIALYMTALHTIIAEAVKQHPHGAAEGLAFVHSLLKLLPMALGIILVMGLALLGLVTGAMGKAYIAVTEPETSEAEPTA